MKAATHTQIWSVQIAIDSIAARRAEVARQLRSVARSNAADQMFVLVEGGDLDVAFCASGDRTAMRELLSRMGLEPHAQTAKAAGRGLAWLAIFFAGESKATPLPPVAMLVREGACRAGRAA